MLRETRTSFLRLLLAAAATLLLAAPAVAGGSPSGLELRKIRHVLDDRGRVNLRLKLVDVGIGSITILGIAPSRLGPWTDVGQTLAPGATMTAVMPASAHSQALWVDSSRGLIEFDLPASN